ncbi:MAG: valine--tRNA ligase [Candidatus Xenobiia bacterium LiM19]
MEINETAGEKENSAVDSLPKSYDAALIEKKWMDNWSQTEIYRWNAAKSREETFVVDSPPPTVSGSLHVGHVFSYTHQDLIVRYQRMKGLNIFYPMGWDDNGLPTERRVQYLHNVQCDPYKPYVENFVPKGEKKAPPEMISRQNFIELCQTVTEVDEQAFKDLWQHLGLSIDWKQEYATIDDHSRKTSQLSFLKILEDGEAYSTESPTLWDIDFRTAVAQAEVVDKSIPGAFHDIEFGIEGGGSFVIATTRPELLAACVAIMAHPDDNRYRGLFGKRAVTPLFRVPVPILADEHADPEKGTGILMVCTFGDSADVEWWRNYSLPLRQIIGRDGRLQPVTFGAPGWESLNAEAANKFYGEIAGKTAKQAKEHIKELLRQEEAAALPGLAAPLKGEPQPIEHSVKMYEKGERPLEIITTRQWFIRLLDKKETLLEYGSRIEWHPPYMKARYDNWVEGLNQDWCISRQRYFGVPFPLWYPLDGEGHPEYERPIMALPESLPVDPLSETPPGYDESMRGKPGGFIGDPDVMDTWATSSLTPQIASRWAVDEERHRKLFPMDIRPQSHEIIRTWAFYTIAKAYLHHRDIPWRHVIISGWILDPDRKKMAKSRGNVVTPDSLLVKYSSDALRYWAARARLGVDTAYDETVFSKGKRLVTKLFNASRFVAGHLQTRSAESLNPSLITEALDRGFLEHLRECVKKAGQAFERFEYAEALLGIEDFFWSEMCDNYLELVKVRAYAEGDSAGKISAMATLRLSLSIMLRLFAPFVPFLTEEVWSWLYVEKEGQGRSIHTSPWPEEKELSSAALPEENDPFGAAVEVLREVRRVKSEAKVSLKAPLSELTVTGNAGDLVALRAVLNDLLPTSEVSEASLVEGPVEGARFQVKAVLEVREQV